MESKKIQGQGYRLGSAREQELEEALRDSIKSNTEITSEYKNMQVVYSNHSNNTNKENDQLRSNNEKLSKHVYQLIDEVKRLRSKIDTLKSRITDKDLSLAEFKADIRTKSKEMKDFLSKMEALETKLSSAQKDLSMKESEIDPLRAELSALNFILVLKNSELAHMENALASKDDELKQMKDDLALKTSEIHSLESKLSSEPIKIGGEADEKKIPNSVSRSDDAIASDIPSRDLSQYFIREKSMDRAGKINTDIPDHTDDKIDTKIIPKVSDEIDISETNNNILQEIPNMTPYLTQPENNVSSLIESNSQIPIGGIGTIPIVASALMSPLSAYMLLTLLIIAVMWFVVLRRTWDIGKKVMIEAVIYIDSQRAHDLDREIILQKLYYRPDGYYRTVEKMHNACKKAGYNFSLNDIKEWLEKQILHLIHKPRPRFIQYASFNEIQNLNEMHQSDLTPMPHDKIGNRVFKYRLVIKDVATRYRKSCALTNKSASTVAKAIKKIYEDSSHSLSWPNVFRTDKGTEYLAECKDLLLSHDVYFDPKKSKRSNAIGERNHQEFEKHAFIRQDAIDFHLPLSDRSRTW
ncbi:17452_t:CDS:2, partial [Entrophospora sp. SA101]